MQNNPETQIETRSAEVNALGAHRLALPCLWEIGEETHSGQRAPALEKRQAGQVAAAKKKGMQRTV